MVCGSRRALPRYRSCDPVLQRLSRECERMEPLHDDAGAAPPRPQREVGSIRRRPMYPLPLLALLPARRAPEVPEAFLLLRVVRSAVRGVGGGLDAGGSRRLK